jgi:ABC-type multidrug transport system ATPase subunit
VAERKVGNRSRGMSGGERRRLSLAAELIAEPRAFFGDEPTSGLDSAQAQKVIDLVVALTRARGIPQHEQQARVPAPRL